MVSSNIAHSGPPHVTVTEMMSAELAGYGALPEQVCGKSKRTTNCEGLADIQSH